jgi:hypothetical protein
MVTLSEAVGATVPVFQVPPAVHTTTEAIDEKFPPASCSL